LDPKKVNVDGKLSVGERIVAPILLFAGMWALLAP